MRAALSFLILAGLAACAPAVDAPAIRAASVQGSAADTVSVEGEIWRLGWRRTEAGMLVAAGPASRRETRALQNGSEGLARLLDAAAARDDAPQPGDPAKEAAAAAVMAADAERSRCRPEGAHGTVAPEDHGALKLGGPRFSRPHGVWMFEATCVFDAGKG